MPESVSGIGDTTHNNRPLQLLGAANWSPNCSVPGTQPMLVQGRIPRMDMVCHEDPTVNIDTKPRRPILQPLSIGRNISIAGE